MYSLLQPFSRPNVNELLGQRIDVLYSCTLPGGGGNVLRWCQGEVIEIYTGKQKPTVRVLWDPMPDVEGSEESSETNAILLPSKWRKETEGGWRMDVDITVQDELDEENNVENVIVREMKMKAIASLVHPITSNSTSLLISIMLTCVGPYKGDVI